MTETTPLLQQSNDISRYNTAAGVGEGKGRDVKPLVHEAESEVSVHEIVKAIFSEWKKNGANVNLTPQDIMAMHMQYRQITKGREVNHSHHKIINELTDAMFSHLRHTRIHVCHPFFYKRFKIFTNLQENWRSIISFDESLARSLNVSHSSACRERFRNVWKSCQHKYALIENSMSDFICQLLLCIILLSWPLSVMIIGARFESECTMTNFLPDAMVVVGVLGTVALLMRLLLASIEECYWNRVRRVMTIMWTALKLLEFVFFLAFAAQLWFFYEDSPSYETEDPTFCNETFYTFTFWMNQISTFFAGVWLASYLVKAILWLTKIRYHYMPPFHEISDS